MIRIKSGISLIYRLYDVAHEINLPGVEERLHKEARRLKILLELVIVILIILEIVIFSK